MKWRSRMEQELERDIADHIAMETEDNIARGLSPAEARFAALRKFGNVGRVKEDTRSVWGWTALGTWCADVRHALRRIRRSPAGKQSVPGWQYLRQICRQPEERHHPHHHRRTAARHSAGCGLRQCDRHPAGPRGTTASRNGHSTGVGRLARAAGSGVDGGKRRIVHVRGRTGPDWRPGAHESAAGLAARHCGPHPFRVFLRSAVSILRVHIPIRSLLIVMQVAAAELLLFTAGLVFDTLSALRRVDPGFDPHRPVAMALLLPSGEDGSPLQIDREAVRDRLARSPGKSFVPSKRRMSK